MRGTKQKNEVYTNTVHTLKKSVCQSKHHANATPGGTNLPSEIFEFPLWKIWGKGGDIRVEILIVL